MEIDRVLLEAMGVHARAAAATGRPTVTMAKRHTTVSVELSR